MTRSEHLQWYKDRALAYLREGMASFSSDMMKHPETNATMQNGIAQPLIMQALMTNNADECVRCVEGFA